jgi:tetratricopeptide (TPR) repeat protein
MSTSRERLKDAAALTLIIVLIAILYGRTLGFGFAYDDDPLIENNPYLKNPGYATAFFLTDMWRLSSMSAISNYYRPLDMFSFYLDYKAWGLDPGRFHLTNLFIFTLASILVYMAIRIITGQVAVSVAGAALFVAHPVSGLAASWISGRNEPLFLIFGLSSFILFLKSSEASTSFRRILLYSLSAIMFALALLSKETALLILPLLAWYDISFSADFSLKRFFKYAVNYIPLALVAAIYLCVRFAALDGSAGIYMRHPENMPLIKCILLTIKSVPYYIKSLIFPFPLQFHALKVPVVYEPGASGIISTAGLLAFLIYYLMRFGLKFRKEIFFLGWAAITSVSVVFVAILMAPRYLIFPLIGLAAFTFLFLERTCRKSIFYASALILIISFGAASYTVTSHWKDNKTLLDLMVKVYPNDVVVHWQLGSVYSLRGDYYNAIREYKEALNIDEGFSMARFNLGHAYYKTGKIYEAVVEFNKIAVSDPSMPQVHQALAVIYKERDMLRKAIEMVIYELSLCTADYELMMNLLAELYERDGQYKNASTITKLILKY